MRAFTRAMEGNEFASRNMPLRREEEEEAEDCVALTELAVRVRGDAVGPSTRCVRRRRVSGDDEEEKEEEEEEEGGAAVDDNVAAASPAAGPRRRGTWGTMGDVGSEPALPHAVVASCS